MDQHLEQIGTRGTLAGEACEIVGQVAVAEPQEVVQLLASPSGCLFRTTHVFLKLIVHQPRTMERHSSRDSVEENSDY